MDLKTSKSGARTYLQMTESYRHRNSGKPRWRHIANLVRMDKLVEADLDSLIEGLLKVIGRPSLVQVEASTGKQAATFDRNSSGVAFSLASGELTAVCSSGCCANSKGFRCTDYAWPREKNARA